jgi:hypothetical protein
VKSNLPIFLGNADFSLNTIKEIISQGETKDSSCPGNPEVQF